MAPTTRRYIVSIQALRAIAALWVVTSHLTHDGIEAGFDPRGYVAFASHAWPWDSGVDLFFVISGFIIATSLQTHRSAGWPGARRFLVRRWQRIVPLYWFTTVLFLGIALVTPGVIHGDIGGAAAIVAAFLFIPWPRPDGLMQPAFGLGWTLNYEMFFYLLFALCVLLTRTRAVMVTLAALFAIAAAGALLHPVNRLLAFWSSPIILEFSGGLVLAWLRGANVRLPVYARIACVPAAIWLLHVHAETAEAYRMIAWGPACLLLVAAATLGPPPQLRGALAERWAWRVTVLGEASYALYLTHPFVMRGLSVSFHIFHGHSETLGLMYLACGLALAQLCALVVHLHLDARVQAWLRRRCAGAQDETLQMPGLQPDPLLRELDLREL